MHVDLVSLFLSGSTVYDPKTLLGVFLAPQIETVVEYLKKNWFLPAWLAPYGALVIAVIAEVSLAMFYHIPLTATVIGSIVTCAMTCWYHELSS